MMQKIYKFFKEKKEKGQSIIEYGILIAVVVTAVVAVRTSVKLDETMTTIANDIKAQLTAADNQIKPTTGG